MVSSPNTSTNDTIPCFEFLNVSLQGHFVDYKTGKEKYSYRHRVFFHSTITFDHLRLAVNNVRNFSYVPRMFSRSQNYVNLY